MNTKLAKKKYCTEINIFAEILENVQIIVVVHGKGEKGKK